MLTLAQRTQQALDAGFTNAQLAKAAGVTSGAVSQWLTTTKNLKADSVIGLARLTGWRVEWWADGKAPRQATAVGPSTSSVDEPVPRRDLTLSISDVSAIYANLDEPEKQLFVRLLLAAGFKLPGVNVEVELWERNDKSLAQPLKISLEPHAAKPRRPQKRASK